MTRIYTRTGDKGETGLIGGRRVPKDDARVEAYGCLDELNSAIGAARAFLAEGRDESSRPAGEAAPADVDEALERIQHDLFALGAEVAAPAGGAKVPQVAAQQVEALERLIDRFDAALPPLHAFILPGGSPAGALLHLARTVSRRAERRIVSLARAEALNPEILRYLNRLGDLLFVLARTVNHRAGAAETEWRPGKGDA